MQYDITAKLDYKRNSDFIDPHIVIFCLLNRSAKLLANKMVLVLNNFDFRYAFGVESDFGALDTGKSNLLLMKDDANYMIQASARWDKKTLVICTKINGEWGNQETIENFDYPVGTIITVRIEAHKTAYAVYVNNNLVSKYPHRLPVEEIEKAKFYAAENELKKLGILFRLQ